jgi:hypothetical protein
MGGLLEGDKPPFKKSTEHWSQIGALVHSCRGLLIIKQGLGVLFSLLDKGP